MCWFHKWEAVGVNLLTVTNVIYNTSKDITVVLYRCYKCGKIRSEDILGTWTLDEVQGKK